MNSKEFLQRTFVLNMVQSCGYKLSCINTMQKDLRKLLTDANAAILLIGNEVSKGNLDKEDLEYAKTIFIQFDNDLLLIGRSFFGGRDLLQQFLDDTDCLVKKLK